MWNDLVNRYHFFDHIIETDLVIPELPATITGVSPSVTISAGAPGVKYEEEVHVWMNEGVPEMSCDRHDHWYRLVLTGEVVTHIDTRNLRILYETGDGVDLPTLRHFLIDQALPRLLGHGGSLVLHGGCISNGTVCVVLLGETGAGKSTLCASFLNAGWTVMSDDCLLVEAGEVPLVRGAYSGIRLYPETISSLAMQDYETSPMAVYSDKKRICTDDDVEPCSLPLKLVVSLKEGDSISVDRLTGSAAVMELVSGSFSLAPRDSTLAVNRVKRYAEIVDHGLPVFSCRYPRDFLQLAAVKKSILDTLGSIE
jgi:hypothetical protein